MIRDSILKVSVVALLFLSFTNTVLAAGDGKGQGQPAVAAKMQKDNHAQHEKVARERKADAQGELERREEKERLRKDAGQASGKAESVEKKARNEERKQVKEEYKTATRSGDADKVKGKKPWWKFWGSDNPS